MDDFDFWVDKTIRSCFTVKEKEISIESMKSLFCGAGGKRNQPIFISVSVINVYVFRVVMQPLCIYVCISVRFVYLIPLGVEPSSLTAYLLKGLLTFLNGFISFSTAGNGFFHATLSLSLFWGGNFPVAHFARQ